MILETGQRKVGGLAAMFGAPELDFKRAAVDFVAELSRSPRAGSDRKALDMTDALVHADELPVPMFGVDLNLRCTFWNSRAADATGWTESEVFSMPNFTASLFNNQGCEELLKAACEGRESSQEIWSLKSKWRKELNALLLANARTDSMGAVCGVVCVIMLLSPPQMEQSLLNVDSTACAMDRMSILDLEEESPNSCGSPCGSEDMFLAALERPSSPYFDGSVRDAIDIYMDQATSTSFEAEDSSFYSQEPEGSSICSQDWCKSEQSMGTIRGAGINLGRSLTQVRALVVDPNVRGRKSLSLMLERCGFEVCCASNETEALDSFEQSMQDLEGFSIVFVNFDNTRREDYALVRHFRSAESRCNSSDFTTQTVLVAVTDLDRWQGSKQKKVPAGLDAIIHYPSRVQQLRDTLNSLGVPGDNVNFTNSSWNNPLVLAR
ncbi:uncharacterized protein [Physcomitrium patens]|uniref:Response regulatory domain-containing protein n=1 Tax=Physcomitrium patens TaxID=3218 RepID=A0A2K1KTV0_PHYPA|nr:uncharacterized protein LOC112279336 [Physcomitrium patens]PNR57215.1 hypothetical protein PHYPA_004208 [Physcomitrium patens]|eukprot:XP_024369451.1 uncharacterized protein LOC112279336 [Physcomitrella patens]